MDYMVVAETECAACGGTGLYKGMAEPARTAVVCLDCKGTGCKRISYKPFVTRKEREGIEWVKNSAGTFIATGIGPVGMAITYQEFKEGKMP
jgi:hypothetical protein